jgi:hypothetical protein
MNDFSHTYQRIQEHEVSSEHEHSVRAYFMCKNQKDVSNLLLSSTLNIRQQQIKKKRRVLEVIIDIIKLIGKRGLSYRGKKYEAAYTLADPTLDHGNFLELIMLVSKYDVHLKEHLNEVIEKSKNIREKGQQRRSGSFVSLLSKTTVNSILQIIRELIKTSILEEIQKAEIFSVQLDTTQDISVQDQCSIVIRYVLGCEIYERLVSVVSCTDSTGKGMFNLIQKEFSSLNIPLKNCVSNATDGAANMQGAYNGFSKWISENTPSQLHVWCYSHILNLVVSDTVKITINAASLFTLLNSIAIFFKESYQRTNIWKSTSLEAKKKRNYK